LSLQAEQEFSKREAVAGAASPGHVAVTNHVLERDAVARHDLFAQGCEFLHLLWGGSGRSFAAVGVVGTAEVADERDAQVRVVAFCVCSLAPLGPAVFDRTVGKDEEVVGDVIFVALAAYVEAARAVKFIDVAFVTRHLVVAREEC